MGRLIDADVLKNIIASEKNDNDEMCRMCIESTKEIIDEQPTAYDPDKVVEQLKKKRADVLSMLRQNKGTLLEYVFKSEYDIWNEAVEIVKGGGANA
mgnify:CR=1 FL=1